jgi:hypothetical protein
MIAQSVNRPWVKWPRNRCSAPGSCKRSFCTRQSSNRLYDSSNLLSDRYIDCVCKKVNLSLCLNNWTLLHESVWGSGCIDPYFLDLGTSLEVCGQLHASAALLPRKSSRYPLHRRLYSPQNRSGRHGDGKILDSTGTQILTPLVVKPMDSRYTDCFLEGKRF